jgi:hypothetical protein
MNEMTNPISIQQDNEVAMGMGLSNMYFGALYALSERRPNSGALVNRIADCLEPLNRAGTVLLHAANATDDAPEAAHYLATDQARQIGMYPAHSAIRRSYVLFWSTPRPTRKTTRSGARSRRLRDI